jgi:hypothetical protein
MGRGQSTVVVPNSEVNMAEEKSPSSLEDPVAAAQYDDKTPTAFVTTRSGGIIDVNNVPGVVRARMISSGEVSLNRFVGAENMPGTKLKPIRDRFAASMEKAVEKVATEEASEENPLKVGDMVEYKDNIYEVLKVDGKKIMIERTINGEKKEQWITYTRVQKG